jgi:hypothetical protein
MLVPHGTIARLEARGLAKLNQLRVINGSRCFGCFGPEKLWGRVSISNTRAREKGKKKKVGVGPGTEGSHGR